MVHIWAMNKFKKSHGENILNIHQHPMLAVEIESNPWRVNNVKDDLSSQLIKLTE